MATPIPISEAAIDDLHRRLDQFVWPHRATGAARPGFDTAQLRPLVEHWRNNFDWRVVEAQLGQRITTTDGGRRIHAIHAQSDGQRLPVLLVHGWPDSPLRFVDLIPRLTAAGHDVVAPAIPGFGFSDEPAEEISFELIAEDFHSSMAELGYGRYAVHGGDLGSGVATTLATAHPEAVAALHLTDVPFDRAFTLDRNIASEAEGYYLDTLERFGEGQLYLKANMQQPDVLALALADSPVGLLAWLAHLYDQWTDGKLGHDHLLANASLLWLTGTVRSSMRLYSEPAGPWDSTSWEGQEAGADSGDGAAESKHAAEENTQNRAPCRIEVPTAFALFPHDIAMAPREFAERHYRVNRFTVMPQGGHFAALEQPDLLASDLVAFLEELPMQR
ncbi:MAG: epoxide hydrolase 1 [Proteobacteria bacterium]|nr:epoxide hydrolase 1 [Pseudomonadota bacterium]